MEVDENSTNDSEQTMNISHNSAMIKLKISLGEYKISNKRGRSKVWEVFGAILTETENELSNLVACRNCKNIYKFNRNSTSNLVKHKCYVNCQLRNRNVGASKKVTDLEEKKSVVRLVTKWVIENCRPFKIIQDSGLKSFAEYLTDLGSKHGSILDIDDLLPHPTTISRNVHNIYNVYFKSVKDEIKLIKKNGFGLTSDLWTDNYLKTTYIALTIHYIKDGLLKSRLLGILSMDGDKSTALNIKIKICKLLDNFDCELNDKVIIVTDRGANMIAAFRSNNNIYCINHLLHNSIEKSIKEVSELDDLCNMCTKLVKYFKKSGMNSTLSSTLKSFSPTRWNTIYYLFESIQKNWVEITNVLQNKNELQRINHINLIYITAIAQILQNFEETSKKLEGESYVTLHLVYVHVHRLKKICSVVHGDLDIVQNFKLKLSSFLETLVIGNLTVYHKIALYLYPPANKLIQFSESEKKIVKDECKRLMERYIQDISEDVNISLSEDFTGNEGLFKDFVEDPEILTSNERIHSEIMIYDSMHVPCHNDFNVLQWWQIHQAQLPLLFKLSLNILATPASSAASERTFSSARNLISEKRTSIGKDATSINQIMFLHSNIPKSDISIQLENYVIMN